MPKTSAQTTGDGNVKSGGRQTFLDIMEAGGNKSHQQHIASSAAAASSASASNTIPHPLSNIQPSSVSNSSANDKGTNDMAQLLQQLSMNHASRQSQPHQQSNTKISDILFAMSSKGGASGGAGAAGAEGGEGGRGNPLMNAVKLEDLEKF